MALWDARCAAALDPAFDKAHYREALAAQRLGDPAAALAAAERAAAASGAASAAGVGGDEVAGLVAALRLTAGGGALGAAGGAAVEEVAAAAPPRRWVHPAIEEARCASLGRHLAVAGVETAAAEEAMEAGAGEAGGPSGLDLPAATDVLCDVPLACVVAKCVAARAPLTAAAQ